MTITMKFQYFLIKKEFPNEIDNELIRKSLIFTRNILLKNFFHK